MHDQGNDARAEGYIAYYCGAPGLAAIITHRANTQRDSGGARTGIDAERMRNVVVARADDAVHDALVFSGHGVLVAVGITIGGGVGEDQQVVVGH